MLMVNATEDVLQDELSGGLHSSVIVILGPAKAISYLDGCQTTYYFFIIIY